MLLYSAGEPVRSTFSLIFDNSRFGEILLPDFKSCYQQLHLGARLIEENLDRYGTGALLGTLQYAVDTSAERMREAIARIPDGDYVGTALVDADGLDDTEEFRIKVTLIKRGEHIEAELSRHVPAGAHVDQREHARLEDGRRRGDHDAARPVDSRSRPGS